MKTKSVQVIAISKLIITVSLVLIVTGCTSMNSEFDCPNKPGVTCRSLDQVNSMIDKNMIGNDDAINKSGTIKTCSACSYTNKISNHKQSYVDEDKVRVWIASYQDVNGNYHEESIIRAVVSKDVISAPKEIVEAK